MAKKCFCPLLTFLITILILLSSVSAVFAEETAQGDSAEETVDSSALVGITTEPVTTEPETTVSKARYPVLTVNAISNYFGKAYAEYNEFTREVTVTYLLKASKRLVSANWQLTYDSAILSVDRAKNTKQTICPVIGDRSVVLFADGEIDYGVTDLKMFDFTAVESPFVQIVFDVAPLTELDSEITKVDLSVENFVVSEPNPVTGESLWEKERVLVANGKVLENKTTDAVLVSKITSLSPSTFVEPDLSGATPDQIVTTEAPTLITTEPTVATEPSKPAVSPNPKPKEADGRLIWTGEWYVALMILLVLLACSIVLFVMRKRDIYNN